jgi:hypothetical protein
MRRSLSGSNGRGQKSRSEADQYARGGGIFLFPRRPADWSRSAICASPAISTKPSDDSDSSQLAGRTPWGGIFPRLIRRNPCLRIGLGREAQQRLPHAVGADDVNLEPHA